MPPAASVRDFLSAALSRLKQLLADAMLDNQALKGLLAKNW